MAAKDNISDAQMREMLELHAERSGTRLHEDGSISLPSGHRVPGAGHSFWMNGKDEGTTLSSDIPNERGGLSSVISSSGNSAATRTIAPLLRDRDGIGTFIGPAYGGEGTEDALTGHMGSPLPNASEIAQKHLDRDDTVGDSSIEHLRDFVAPAGLPRKVSAENLAQMAKNRHLVNVHTTIFHTGSNTRRFNLKTGTFEQD